MNQDNTPSKQAYGGRPLWQWVLIYLVVGGAIYAAIYYFMANKSVNGYGQPTKASAQTAAPAASPPMQQQSAPATGQTPMRQTSGGNYNW